MPGKTGEARPSPSHPSVLSWDITSSWEPSRASQTRKCPFQCHCICHSGRLWSVMLVARMWLVRNLLVSLLPDTVLGRCQMLIILLWNEWVYQETDPQNAFFLLMSPLFAEDSQAAGHLPQPWLPTQEGRDERRLGARDCGVPPLTSYRSWEVHLTYGWEWGSERLSNYLKIQNLKAVQTES